MSPCGIYDRPCHRSRDHRIHYGSLYMVSLKQPSNLHSYSASKILGVTTLTFEVTRRDVIGDVTIGLAIYGFPLVFNLNPPSTSHSTGS